MRKYGLTSDNLLSADVVTADGRYLTASPEENEDLFWALRGGGGNFGIVTSFEYRLHPVGPVVVGGAVFYEAEKAGELLQFYSEWTAGLPDELTTLVAFLTAPPEPFIPEHLQGKPVVAVAVCYSGAVEEGMKAVQTLKEFGPPAVDVIGPMPYTALQTMFDAGAPRGIHSYWKTEYLAELTEEAASTLITQAAQRSSPFSQVHLHHLEGAFSRVDGSASGFGRRDARYIVNIIGMWMDSKLGEEETQWVRQAWQEMQPHSAGGAYLNFMDGDEEKRISGAYGANYKRLRQIKAKYDPDNFFRMNQNIEPA